METPKKAPRVKDYSGHINFVLNQYNDAKGFVHGFQKDAIQNAVGARKNSDYSGWQCRIDVRNTDKGTFVIVEDFGTVGLTGPNYPYSVLKERTKKHEQFPPEERLARISCDNVSGGDKNSPGLFGVGKILYVAASSKNLIYFDSLTEKEGYRCNCNDEDEMYETACEGQTAKDIIYQNTGLEPLDHVGTRFIITDPKQEIVDGILGEKQEMLHDAEETWWRVIRYLKPEEGIFINGVRAEIPSTYRKSEDDEVDVKDNYFSKIPVPISAGRRYKKFGFYISDDIPEELAGFYYYRRGMKVGQVNLDAYEKDINSRYYGFIELEPEWEDQLALIENSTHYDAQRWFKNNAEYADLRRAVQKVVGSLLEEWGYSKTEVNEQKFLNSLLDDLNEEVSTLFADQGYERIGTGNKRSPFTVRLLDVKYPHESEGEKLARTVYTGDHISFSFEIRNKGARPLKFNISGNLKSQDGTVSESIYSKLVPIVPGEPFQDSIDFVVTQDNSVSNQIGSMILSVAPTTGSKKPSVKTLYYYYGIDTFVRPDEDFSFDINSLDFPNTPSRRVDTDQWVKNITYSMVNRTSKPIKVILRVNTNSGSGTHDLLQTVCKKEYVLPPNGEEVTTEPLDIQFTAEDYYSKIRRGILEVRAKMLLGEDLPDNKPPLDKTKTLGGYVFKVYFNCPDSTGNKFDHELVSNENRHERVYLDPAVKDKIIINSAFPQCKMLVGAKEQEEYMAEMLIRGYIMVFASNGYFDNAETDKMSNTEYALYISDQIEEMWYQKCSAMKPTTKEN